MENVYISGRGLMTPLGTGLAANEAALRSGKSGLSRIPDFVERNLPSVVGGRANEAITTPLIDRKQMRFCTPTSVMSVVAAAEAFAEAGLALEELPDRRIALVGGVASSPFGEIYQVATECVARGRLTPVATCIVPRVMPSSPISNLSLIFKLKGESYDVSAACATSAVAIMLGTRLIRSGAYDMVLAGGAEQLDWIQTLGFCACRALSKNFNDAPEKASRPFDRDRDGFVLASGAGYVVLESERSLKARGGRPITRVAGLGANSNATDMVVPSVGAISEVMQMAIADAGITPREIGYVNTHGTGTPVGDPVELEAIRQVIGSHAAINSTKSQTGHMVGATGAAEIIFTSMMLEKKFVSGTLNLENPDEGTEWADLVRTTRPAPGLSYAISNSFAFGGSNAAVVLQGM